MGVKLVEISKLLYIDLPKFISAVKHLVSTSTIQSRGLSFNLISDNWITKYRARSFNDKEPEMLDWLDENLHEGDVFFDVGANVGIYSIYAALRNPQTTVYAFEPEYSNLNQLKQNILNNNLMDNVIPFSIALGDHTGISYLRIQDTTPGAALHTESRKTIDKTYGKDVIWKEGIGTSTLDFINENIGAQPNLIKIDVDGNELNILRGGDKTFNSSDLRSVIIEIVDGHPNNNKVIKFLKDHGFILKQAFEENQIWFRG
jgi:FkbM family methyltransferase